MTEKGQAMNMVERVSRALYRSNRGFDQAKEDAYWHEFERDARGAIEAMREEDLRLELAWRKFRLCYTVEADGCWNWNGALDRRDGYGRFYDGTGNTQTAYGFAWKYVNRPVEKGMVLDHTCRNRRCVNPAHLRQVTNAENVLCGSGITAENLRKTQCRNGHALEYDNLYYRPNGHRSCRPCLREAHARYRAKKRAALTE